MSLADRLIAWAGRREPNFVIGGAENPYLRRWWLLPRNRVLNVYVHQFLRSDDDRALHDHPWTNCSIVLRGAYAEHTIAQGGVHRVAYRKAGDWHFRWTGRMAHRIEIEAPCWTLFLTGPRYREWFFHCTERGLVHWKAFTAADNPGAIGRGCAQ